MTSCCVLFITTLPVFTLSHTFPSADSLQWGRNFHWKDDSHNVISLISWSWITRGCQRASLAYLPEKRKEQLLSSCQVELELQKEEVGQVGKRILNLLMTVPLTSRAVGYWSLAPELFTLLVDFVYLKRSQRSCRRCMEYIHYGYRNQGVCFKPVPFEGVVFNSLPSAPLGWNFQHLSSHWWLLWHLPAPWGAQLWGLSYFALTKR